MPPLVVRKMVLRKHWLAALALAGAVALPADARAEAVSYQPGPLFDKALAADRAGGLEMFAIAWYRAYLAAQPKADNAAQVRERIAGIEVEVEAKVRELLNKAGAAAAALPTPAARTDALRRIAAVLAGAGDISGAERIAVTLPAHDRDFVAMNIAVARMRNGDGKEAVAAAASITDATLAASARRGIARVLGFTGDVAGARKIADAIADDKERAGAFAGIAEAELIAGNTPGAGQAIARAKSAAAQIALEPIRAHAYFHIAAAQFRGGDAEGARETAALVSRDNLRRQLDDLLAQSLPRPAAITDEASASRAEIDDWARIVGTRLNQPHFTDFPVFWRSLRDKQLDDVVEELLRVAADFIDALNELREREMSWWPHRPG